MSQVAEQVVTSIYTKENDCFMYRNPSSVTYVLNVKKISIDLLKKKETEKLLSLTHYI